MRQSNYETIVKCMQHGAPAIFGDLLNDFNATMEDANNYRAYMAEKQRIEEENKAAEQAAKERKTPNQANK